MQRSLILSSDQAQLLLERAKQVSPDLLTAIREVARALDSNVYLVGGAVRDLVLSGRVKDLDLLVEADGEKFARSLSAALKGTVRGHSRFGTATVEVHGERFDVATARREHYDSPAALPRVEPGDLSDDLRRRDFTVNTLVIDLAEGPPFEILDRYGALEDIERRSLRVLHDRSFMDDPTRLLRGIGFESRLGFRMDETTESLARTALAEGAFDELSGDRLSRELFRLLEPAAGAAETRLDRLAELGFLKVLHPELEYQKATGARIARALVTSRELPGGMGVEGWRIVLPWLLAPLDRREIEVTADRLALRAEDRRWLAAARSEVEQAVGVLLRSGVTPYEVDRSLRPLKSEQLAHLLASESAPVVQWTGRWLDELRSFRLSVKGRDLVAAGASPGPRIGRALERTREARLNGRITAEKELEFALETLQSTDPVEAGEA